MNVLQILFSTDFIFITIHGYPLSFIEALATILSLWAYIEIIRKKLRGFIIGGLSTITLCLLFYQLRLYSDMLLMAYYTLASLVALLVWKHQKKKMLSKSIQVSRLTGRQRLILLILLPLLTLILVGIVRHLHLWTPLLFPQPARFLTTDAITTVLGITASILLIQRKLEYALLWLLGDLLSLYIYFRCNIYFLSFINTLYALIGATGLILWSREWKRRVLSSE